MSSTAPVDGKHRRSRWRKIQKIQQTDRSGSVLKSDPQGEGGKKAEWALGIPPAEKKYWKLSLSIAEGIEKYLE
jgi:hypothetical protein